MGLSYERGHAGERAALLYLQEKGYHLLAQNFRISATRSLGQRLSEIDLIFLAADEQLCSAPDSPVACLETGDLHSLRVVFVEVKNWQAFPLSDLAFNLTADRQRRLFETAELYLQHNPKYQNLQRRFDLIILQGAESETIHIKAAFP